MCAFKRRGEEHLPQIFRVGAGYSVPRLGQCVRNGRVLFDRSSCSYINSCILKIFSTHNNSYARTLCLRLINFMNGGNECPRCPYAPYMVVVNRAPALHVCVFLRSVYICSPRIAQQYYCSLTGHEFTNEVACSRDSHNCDMRRLVERRNHTHPVIIRTPPTDLTLFEPLSQVG